MHLVVGATGQLGTAIVRKLAAAGQPVRAFVRPGSRHEHLKRPGIELAYGDLRDAASVEAACHGARAVLATANAVIPEGPSSFDAVEGQGYRDLIDACRRHAVEQLVYVSVPVTPHDEAVPNFRHKRRNEAAIQASGLGYTILRSSLFMDDWFAFIGSRLPGRGAEACLLERRFWFLQLFLKGVEGLIERRGVALIPGHARARHAFITVDNVADFMVKAVGHPAARNATLEIGGPEILTWGEVAATYADVLGRSVRPVYAPGGVFRVASRLTAPFSEAVSDILGLNWLVAYDTAHDARRLAETMGVRLTSADRFLREKAALPAA